MKHSKQYNSFILLLCRVIFEQERGGYSWIVEKKNLRLYRKTSIIYLQGTMLYLQGS